MKRLIKGCNILGISFLKTGYRLSFGLFLIVRNVEKMNCRQPWRFIAMGSREYLNQPV